MKVEITASIVAIGLIFGLGYFYILVFVVTQPTGSYSALRFEMLEKVGDVQSLLMSKNAEIDELQLKLNSNSIITTSNATAIPKTNNYRPGVIILGMHRSGTSVLGGLINKMGLNTGGPLILPAEDNAKGFFERIDIVLQNDYIMKKQKVHYSVETYRYDSLIGLNDILTAGLKSDFFAEGYRGLSFLNDRNNYPWMLKDPRLCITLRTWLPLLNFIPVVLFTYRHPMDVALSMNKREYEQFKIQRTLKLWYVYNRRAVEQSHDLCRVITSHRLVMKQPSIELNRIYDELHQCGLDVPKSVTNEDITSFIDIKLQHGRTTLKDTSCDSNLNELMPPETWKTTEQTHIELYRKVMIAYCAMEDGSAFDSRQFQWDHEIKDN